MCPNVGSFARMKKADLHIRIRAELFEQLRAESARRGISLNALVAVILDEWANPKG